MAEIDCFIEFQNAEPFMMSIDKEVNYQTFDEEIKKRLSKNIQDELLYSYDSLNGETFIQNNNDLVNALAYAESFGDDFLFVIKIAEKEKNNEEFEEEEYEEEEEEEGNELKELEELEELVPEEQKETSFSVPIVEQKTENVNEEKKESDKKDERVDFFEFLKNQISEQLPALSPILESLNIENIINNNVNNNNDHNENKDNMREVLEEIPNIVKQFLPAVLDNLQNLPNAFPIPPPPPHPHSHPHPFAQAFPFPPPPPPPSQFHPFAQAFPFPFPFPPVPSTCKSSEQKSAEQVPNPFPFLSAFVPPSNQSPNPFIDLLNGVLNSKQMPQNKCPEKPKQRPVQFHMAKCDHCDRQILGIRYKCLTCEDFDLCEKCEVNSPQVHNPDHIFAKIRNANQMVAPSPIPQPAPHRRDHMHPHIHRVPHDHPLKPRAHPHFHPHPHSHPHPMSHFTTITQPSIKPNVVRVVPPHVHPQFPSHANVHRAPQPPHGCKAHVHSVPIAVQSRPKPVPENNRVKTLEEQIASLESQIANIKSSLPQREPKPRTSIFNHNNYYYSLDDSEDDDSDDDDQVFEIKVNRRL